MPLRLLCSSSDTAQRAFLKPINSVHIGDMDVLKSSFCCAHWPQSAASEGLWWGDKWLLFSYTFLTSLFLIHSKRKASISQRTKKRKGWIFDVSIYVFFSPLKLRLFSMIPPEIYRSKENHRGAPIWLLLLETKQNTSLILISRKGV